MCGRHGTEDDDVTHGDLVVSDADTPNRAGVKIKPRRSGHVGCLKGKRDSTVTDAIRKPRSAYRTHGEKSESRIVLRNGRTTETSRPAAAVWLATPHSKGEDAGEGGSLHGDGSLNGHRE